MRRKLGGSRRRDKKAPLCWLCSRRCDSKQCSSCDVLIRRLRDKGAARLLRRAAVRHAERTLSQGALDFGEGA